MGRNISADEMLERARRFLHAIHWGRAMPVKLTNGNDGIMRRAIMPRDWPTEGEPKTVLTECKPALARLGFTLRHTAKGEPLAIWISDPSQEAQKRAEIARIQAEEAEAARDALEDPSEIEIDDRIVRDKPHQPPGVRRLVKAARKHGSAIDGSSTGVGKSYMAASAAVNLAGPGGHIAVICPRSVRPAWRRVLFAFGVSPLFLANYEKLRRGGTEWVAAIYSEKKGEEGEPEAEPEEGEGEAPKVKKKKRPRIERFEWNLPAGTVVIFDECHNAKGYPPSLNAKLLHALRDKAIVLALSGTLATTPAELWAVGFVVGLWKDDFSRWLKDNGCRIQGKRWKVHDPDAMLRLRKRIFPERGNRIRHQDIADFPENYKQVECWTFDNTGKINEVYREMQRELAELRAKAEKCPSKFQELVIMLRARQETELLKVPNFASEAEDAAGQGYFVPIFLNFQQSIDALCERLKTDCVITGEQTMEERQACIDRFQSGRSPYIICNMQAGGTGVSLHDESGQRERMALISPNFSAFQLAQACGRHHRSGGANAITRIVFAAGTIEESCIVAVQEKLENLDRLNDGELTFSASLQYVEKDPGAFLPGMGELPALALADAQDWENDEDCP